MITIQAESVRGPDAQSLIEELSRELASRYDEDDDGNFAPEDVEIPGAAFVILRQSGQATGCGAIRPFAEPGVAEVKRMYVRPDARGRGLSRLILHELEKAALEFGCRCLILETGTRQPEAMALYERSGYSRCPCFGEYMGNPFSVCYRKDLPSG